MTKFIGFLIIFLLFLSITYATTSYNLLSKGQADTLYCSLGSCSGGNGTTSTNGSFSSLKVGNISYMDLRVNKIGYVSYPVITFYWDNYAGPSGLNYLISNDSGLHLTSALDGVADFTARKFIGDGSLLTNLPSSNFSINDTIYAKYQFTNNNFNGSGNFTANYFKGNGAYDSNNKKSIDFLNRVLYSFGGANPVPMLDWSNTEYITIYNGLTLSGGNVTADYFIGDGSKLINLPSANFNNVVFDNITNGNITALNFIGNLSTESIKLTGQTDEYKLGANFTATWINASDDGLPFGSNHSTMNLWVKSSYDSGIIMLFTYGTLNNNQLRAMYTNGGIFWFGAYNAADLNSGVNIADNNWHMLTATYNGSLRLYVDGVYKTSGTYTLATVPKRLTIGGWDGITWSADKTVIAEAHIYNYSMNQSELTTLYNSSNGVYGSGNEYGIQRLFHLNNNTIDSKNGKNGTWIGTGYYANSLFKTGTKIDINSICQLGTNTITCNNNFDIGTYKYTGDGSQLINLPVSNPFDQSLNTTDDVIFNSVKTSALYDSNSYTYLSTDGYGNTCLGDYYAYYGGSYICVDGYGAWTVDGNSVLEGSCSNVNYIHGIAVSCND